MKKKIAMLSALLSVASVSYGEGFYVLGSVGQSHFNNRGDTAIGIATQDNLNIDITSSTFDKNQTGYRAQVGYQFNDNFAIEGGYVSLGEETIKVESNYDAYGYLVSGAGKEKLKVNGINIDGLLLLPVTNGLSLLGKAGVLEAKVQQRSSGKVNVYDETVLPPVLVSSAEFNDSGSARKAVFNFGIGVNYNVYKSFSVRLEAERFFKVGDKQKTGQADIDLFSLGVSYQF